MTKTKTTLAIVLLIFILFIFGSAMKPEPKADVDIITECYNKCTVSQFVELKNKLAEEEKANALKKEQMSKILQESAK
jgi:predicted nucleotidyltransferase